MEFNGRRRAGNTISHRLEDSLGCEGLRVFIWRVIFISLGAENRNSYAVLSL